MLINLKSNNIGTNLNPAFENEINVSPFEGIIESSKPTKLVNITEANIPLLTENRYLNNNDQSISLNYLIGLNKNWEAKINTSATRISATQIGQSNTTLSIPGNSTVYFERITTTKPVAHQLKTLLTLTNNSDKLFIKNILLFQA